MSTLSVDDASLKDDDSIILRRKSFSSALARSQQENYTLHECVRNGDVVALERLLQQTNATLLVNQLDESSQAPLHYAARYNNLRICQLLINVGKARVTVKDDDGATPLHYACRRKVTHASKETSAVIRLLSRHSNFEFGLKDRYGSTPLHFAAMRGNVIAAHTLLQYSKALVNFKDQHGCTPLHEAATYNQVAVAQLLIHHGSKIRALDFDCCTPLHLACVEGSLGIVKLLIESCDDSFLSQLIDAKDKDDTTAFHYAVEARSLPIIKLLAANDAKINSPCRCKSAGSTPLHLAAVAGDEDLTEFLIQSGAKLHAINNRGATPLHEAAQYECTEVAQVLLKHIECDVEDRDMDGHTPLLVAAKYGSEDILEALLQNGAKVSATDKNEKNALHLAAEHMQQEITAILLNHIKETKDKGLVNEQDRSGQTPLHLAARKGNLKIVEMLMDAGGDLTIKDECEETPFLQAAETGRADIVEEMLLRNERVINDEDEFSNIGLHKAAENGHLDVVRTLVEWGAIKEARNNKSWTPLDMGASQGHEEVVEFLLEQGVSPNPQDKNMTTPLHLAAKWGHADTVMRLIDGGADVAAVNVHGLNCLDIAIANGNRYVAVTILKSKAWNIALANERCPVYERRRSTPLRQLFRKMPDVSSIALTNCVVRGCDTYGGEYYEFNFDYIDDNYTDYMDLKMAGKVPKIEDNAQHENKLYTRDKNWIKENHPLAHLVASCTDEYEHLISHPLVLGLIRHKWKAIRVFYFLFLLFYATFVALLTAYMITATAPYQVQVNATVCHSERIWLQSDFENCAKYVIWVMSGCGIIIEVMQAVSQGWLYFHISNLVDWYAYISAIIVVVDIKDNCGLRTGWQWQMGSFSVLFTWLMMLLFLRRLPGLGIFVVMIVEILKTFTKFFVIFFLFVVAFAMSYHILLENEEPFSTPFYSIMKTWVMMLGEMDYNEIFHADSDADDPVYEPAAFAMFWLFLILMAIIVMNLLTGLAVDDVNLLQKKAKLVKIKLQIELALDIELAMPEIWRHRTKSTVRRERIYLKQDNSAFMRLLENIQIAVEGPLLSKMAVLEAANEMSVDRDSELPELMQLETRLNNAITTNREEIKGLHKKLDHIEQLLLLQLKSRENEDQLPPGITKTDSRGGNGGGERGGGVGNRQIKHEPKKGQDGFFLKPDNSTIQAPVRTKPGGVRSGMSLRRSSSASKVNLTAQQTEPETQQRDFSEMPIPGSSSRPEPEPQSVSVLTGILPKDKTRRRKVDSDRMILIESEGDESLA